MTVTDDTTLRELQAWLDQHNAKLQLATLRFGEPARFSATLKIPQLRTHTGSDDSLAVAIKLALDAYTESTY